LHRRGAPDRCAKRLRCVTEAGCGATVRMGGLRTNRMGIVLPLGNGRESHMRYAAG
jgi:hypothetical protein